MLIIYYYVDLRIVIITYLQLTFKIIDGLRLTTIFECCVWLDLRKTWKLLVLKWCGLKSIFFYIF